MDLSAFAMFVRPTGKGVASRYGRGNETIGARRDPRTGEMTIDTSVVVALGHDEWARGQRGYRRQIDEGALEEVDAAAYEAFVAASHAPPPSAEKAPPPPAETAAPAVEEPPAKPAKNRKGADS